MALTFRDNNLAPLSYDEMDSNFRYFTGSFENSGSITAASFISSGNISASGILYANTAYFPDRVITPLLRNPSSISIHSDSDNITLNGQITASGNVSSSATSTASFGTYLGDGSQLSGVSSTPFPFTGDAQISGSLLIANQADPEDIYFRAYDTSGDYSIYIDEQRQVSGRAQLYVGANDKGFNNGNPVVSGYNNVSSSISLYTDRGIYANGNIYGSNISASNTVYGITGSFSHLLGASPLTIQSDNLNLDSTGNITASGNISSSGNLYMNQTPGTDNSVVVLDSTGKLVTDEIDSRVWGSTLANLSNGVDNRVVTSTDANSLNGEENMTFDGSTLDITGTLNCTASRAIGTAANASVGLYYDSTSTPIAQFSRQGGAVTNQQQGLMYLRDRVANPNGTEFVTVALKSNGCSTLGGVNGGLHIGESFDAVSPTNENRKLWLDTDSEAFQPTDTVWNTTSDRRLKENITTASLDICYDGIKSLPLQRYSWKDSSFKPNQVPDKNQLGWIAQDVQAIFPKSVTTGSFTTWATYTGSIAISGSTEGSILESGGVYQDPLAGSTVYNDSLSLNVDQMNKMLFGAVQKLIQKVEALEAQISGSV